MQAKLYLGNTKHAFVKYFLMTKNIFTTVPEYRKIINEIFHETIPEETIINDINTHLYDTHTKLIDSTKKLLRIRFINESGIITNPEFERACIPMCQFIQYFLPEQYNYIVVHQDDEADICLVGDQTKSEMLRMNEINIYVSVENSNYWNHYQHYNKYREYGDDKIDIYYYNHISQMHLTDKIMSIPTIYARIKYFQNAEFIYKNISALDCAFNDKKFCLKINRSSLNPQIDIFVKKLESIGTVDTIQNISDTLNDTCYNGINFLKLLNKYKFIICFENSRNDGYITEKIFNCFFAKTVPLYWGSTIVDKYLNKNSFFTVNNVDLFDMKLIEELACDENKYNAMIDLPKINSSFDNENYCEKLSLFVENKLNSKLNSKRFSKKLICFSLWGSHEFYNYGALENALIAQNIYPDWICRFYYMDGCNSRIINELAKLSNVELVKMDGNDDLSNMIWRFIPAFEEDNIIFLSRDTDSRLNIREKAAVDEWLASPYDFHIMRDHAQHGTEILGGMWGCRNNILHSLGYEFKNMNKINMRGTDQLFLKNHVYPYIKNNVVIHASHNRWEDGCRNFPKTDYLDFVGSYVRTAPLTFKILNENERLLDVMYPYQA